MGSRLREDPERKRCKQRRSGSDTVQFLREHSEMEFQMKREELKAKVMSSYFYLTNRSSTTGDIKHHTA